MSRDSFLSARGTSSSDAAALCGLLVVAGLVRAHAWSQTAVMFNDGPVFLALAEAIGNGQWAAVLAHPYHPLYPLSIAALAQTGLGLEASGVAVSVLGGLLSITALWVFLRQCFGSGIEWLGAWTAALHPWAVDFSSDVMSDGLYTGLYLAGFAALARLAERPSRSAAVTCGALAALAYLVRPEGLGLVVIALVLLGWRIFLERRERSAARKSLVAVLLVSLLVISPYVGWLSWRAGELTLTQKKSVGALVRGRARPDRDDAAAKLAEREVPQAEIWLPQSSRPIDSAVAPPSRDFVGLVGAFGRVLRTSISAIGHEVLVFALIGWLGVGRLAARASPRPWRDRAIGMSIVAYSGLLVLLVWGAGYVSRRHALPAWLPLLGFSAMGWQYLGERITRRLALDPGFLGDPSTRRRWMRALVLALVVVLVLVWGPRDLRARRADRVALREAAEWLAETHPESGPVAAQKLRTAYYARAPHVPLPPGTERRLELDLRAGAARWVVIDEQRLGDHLGLEQGVGDWLRLVRAQRAHGRTAWVLEVIPEPAG